MQSLLLFLQISGADMDRRQWAPIALQSRRCAYQGLVSSLTAIVPLQVFASASVDRSIRVWDTRDRSKSQVTVAAAHGSDVNVIAWNGLTPHTLASGGDDGRLRVWDLRTFVQPVADFSHHRCLHEAKLLEAMSLNTPFQCPSQIFLCENLR